MPQKTRITNHESRITKPSKKRHGLVLNSLFLIPKRWWGKNLWHKILAVFLAFVLVCLGSSYGIARWYIAKNADKPLKLGVTFIPSYARYFELDPAETMQAMIDELGVRRFRLVSYWDDIEKTPGVYDFSDLDWQFAKAEAYNLEISLAIGLRQPRWPECHWPVWVQSLPIEQWSVHLKEFMRRVIERYKTSPVLKDYQLENEFFLKVFGKCPDFSRDRLIDEYNFVKSLDSQHPVIVARSNNALGLPVGQPQPDEFAISVYKRVWDKTITKRYFEYPLPAWFYSFLAGAGQIVTGKDIIIHELQAEAWTPDKYESIKYAPLEEQNKSLNARRLKDRFEYGRATGIRTIDLWGAEWWYWRKIKHNDHSLWEVAREEFSRAHQDNAKLLDAASREP